MTMGWILGVVLIGVALGSVVGFSFNNLKKKYKLQLKEQTTAIDALSKRLNTTSTEHVALANEYTRLTNKYQADTEEIKNKYSLQLSNLQETYNRELSARKSSEVRVGQIAEQMVPFMEGWPYDSKNFRFIGSPIDGLQITDDKILFVEIKTGKSRLSKLQQNIKKLVKEGKVSFVTVRIDGLGVQIEGENEDFKVLSM